MKQRTKRWLHVLLAGVVAIALCLLGTLPSAAQFSLPAGFGQPNPVEPPTAVTRYGNMEAIAVESPLSQQVLFTIAAPTVYHRSAEAIGDRQTVERRAEEIQARLLLLLQRPMDPETLVFEVSQLNNVTVIDVRDDQYPRPLVLLSVTEFDADFNGQPIEELAEEWRTILENELRNGLAKLPRDRQRVNHIATGLLMLTIAVGSLKYALSLGRRRLKQRQRALSEPSGSLTAETNASSDPVPSARPGWRDRSRALFSLPRLIGLVDVVQWVLFWLLMLMWYVGFYWIVIVSPYLIRNRFHFLDSFLSLILIWFCLGLGIRLSHWLIDRVMQRWQHRSFGNFLDLGDSQRRDRRAKTIAIALKGLATILILLVAGLSALGTLGLPTASVIAIGSLAGLAITFGSQNLIKDLVNGFFILAEDQYAIGDVVEIGNVSGQVENLTMRVTQIRSGNGELVTLPNSSITQVKNLTRNWSKVNFSIDVAYHTDPAKALHILRETAQNLYTDPAWQDKMLAEPTVLGIDQVSHSGLTITTSIQTVPGQQWVVGREFRLRVRQAIAASGIEIGIPQSYALTPAPDVSDIAAQSETAEQ